MQEIVSRLLVGELGFAEEVVLTPDTGFVTQARPDFYYQLVPGRGVLAPHANWNEKGLARERPYYRLASRLDAFFSDPRREIDVLSLHMFGYGRLA